MPEQPVLELLASDFVVALIQGGKLPATALVSTEIPSYIPAVKAFLRLLQRRDIDVTIEELLADG